MSDAGSLRDVVSQIVDGMGFSVVDVSRSVVKGRTHVHLVVYRESGVNIDDCAELHKTVAPRLEVLLDDRDIALQVATPGIDRTLKSNAEFAVFAGRGMQILRKSTMEWTSGVVKRSDADSVTIDSGDDLEIIPFADVQRAKLDHLQEVK